MLIVLLCIILELGLYMTYFYQQTSYPNYLRLTFKEYKKLTEVAPFNWCYGIYYQDSMESAWYKEGYIEYHILFSNLDWIKFHIWMATKE